MVDIQVYHSLRSPPSWLTILVEKRNNVMYCDKTHGSEGDHEGQGPVQQSMMDPPMTILG
jgi:hypothetical protein